MSSVPAPADACAQSLLEALGAIEDPRKKRGVRHPLASLLALALTAILCGCQNVSQIHAWARDDQRLLKMLGFVPPKRPRRKESRGRLACPNEDTLATVLGQTSSESINEALALWIGAMMREPMVASVDGKALRGASEYVLSVFVHDLLQVAWQEDVGRDKENELKVFERSIGRILARYPNLSLLIGDAAFCQKSVAKALVKARRDYFLQLKAPHTTDVAIADQAFAQLTARPPLAETVDKRGAQTGRRSSPTRRGATRS